MVHLIKPQTQVTTKQGEATIQITLDLNINLNSDGITTSVNEASAKQVEEKEEKPNWAIGDFSPPKKKIKFGKKVE